MSQYNPDERVLLMAKEMIQTRAQWSKWRQFRVVKDRSGYWFIEQEFMVKETNMGTNVTSMAFKWDRCQLDTAFYKIEDEAKIALGKVKATMEIMENI